MYSCGPPHMDVQVWDDQHEPTYSNYVRTQDVTLKTCRGRWMIGRNGKRGSGISALAARHDDDENKFVEVFGIFLGQLSNLGDLRIQHLSVRTTAFIVNIPPLNRCFRRSRVQITLINPLFCLNSIFPIRKQRFTNTRNLDFSIVLKICNSRFT